MRALLLAGLTLSWAPLAMAATVQVTPDTLGGIMKGVKAGDVVVCSPGTVMATGFIASAKFPYNFNPPITLDLSACTLTSLRLQGVSGVNVIGGHFVRSATPSYLDGIYVLGAGGGNLSFTGQTMDLGRAAHGYQIRDATNVRIANAVIAHPVQGVYAQNVQGLSISAVAIYDSAIDGIDLASVQNAKIDHIVCLALVRTGAAHADCVQLWNVAGAPQTADIEISDSACLGPEQCWTGFTSGSGYDRVNVHDNFSANSVFPTGSQYNDARASSFQNNKMVAGNFKGAASPGMTSCNIAWTSADHTQHSTSPAC